VVPLTGGYLIWFGYAKSPDLYLAITGMLQGDRGYLLIPETGLSDLIVGAELLCAFARAGTGYTTMASLHHHVSCEA